jgi:hypothetical protein
MKKPVVARITAALLPLLAAKALADDALPLALGSRIRVTTDRRTVGTLLARDDQSLTLYVGDAKPPVVVPRAAIRRLDRSVRPSRRAHDAWVGAAVGAGLAIGLGTLAGLCHSGAHPTDVPRYPISTDTCVSGTLVGLAWGILLVPPAAALGALNGDERWRNVPLDRIKVGLAPTRGRGIAGALSFSF